VEIRAAYAPPFDRERRVWGTRSRGRGLVTVTGIRRRRVPVLRHITGGRRLCAGRRVYTFRASAWLAFARASVGAVDDRH